MTFSVDELDGPALCRCPTTLFHLFVYGFSVADITADLSSSSLLLAHIAQGARPVGRAAFVSIVIPNSGDYGKGASFFSIKESACIFCSCMLILEHEDGIFAAKFFFIIHSRGSICSMTKADDKVVTLGRDLWVR